MPEGINPERPIAVIGEEDIAVGFKALGFRVYSPKEAAEFKAVIDEAVKAKPAICLVQDNIYRAEEAYIGSRRNLMLPVFIPFAKDANTVLFDDIMKGIRLKATGVL